MTARLISGRLTPLGRLLDRLAVLDQEERVDAILSEIRETGVAMMPVPMVLDLPCSFCLYEVCVDASNLALACAQWIDAALIAVAPAEQLARARLIFRDETASDTARILACLLIVKKSDDRSEVAEAISIRTRLGRPAFADT